MSRPLRRRQRHGLLLSVYVLQWRTNAGPWRVLHAFTSATGARENLGKMRAQYYEEGGDPRRLRLRRYLPAKRR